ncbi:MAG: T9SS type A sorting domain-containing protein [bacterium]|nr:T9SS type A sorting domain-containing protein [bacterium]
MKQFSWILLLSLTLTGATSATPRWGDDFDWLGDTLAITVPMGMIGFGDTLVCRTPTSMFAMRQTSDTTFQKLWQLNVPVTAEAPLFLGAWDKYSHIVRDCNRFYYGWPRAMVEWNGIDPPVYRGAVRNGTTFVPDTGFLAKAYNNNEPYRNIRPRLHDNILLLANRVYAQDSTGTLNFSGYTDNDTVKYEEYTIRGNYAYRVSSRHSLLSVVKLDTTPIREVYRTQTASSKFCRIINDTLITAYDNIWSVWSLENPRQPQLITTNPLQFKLSMMWDEPVDSVWFAWGLFQREGFFNENRFYLLSFENGVAAPTIVDSVGYVYRGHYDHTITPNNVAHLNRGWFMQFHLYSMTQPNGLLQLRQYRDEFNRQRLDTLWCHRQTTGFDSGYLANRDYSLDACGYWGKNGRAIIQRGYRYAQLVADTVNAHHEIRWLPQSLTPYGHDGDQVIAMRNNYNDSLFHLLTWTNGQWSDQTMPMPNSAQYIAHFQYNQIIIRQGNGHFYVYWIENGVLVPNGTIVQPNGLWEVRAFHGENTILSRYVELNKDSLLWYRKVGNEWIQQNWHAIDSTDLYSSLQSDTLFTANQYIYVLPQQGHPYQSLDLTEQFLSSIIQNHSVVRMVGNNVWARNDHTWQGWVERGMFFSYWPFLYYGSVLLTNTPGAISTYRMPPNNATPELIGTLPFDFALSNPYPNPFNSSIHFRVDLPRSAMTEYAIYDAIGREVYTQPSERLAPGSYTLHWNGRDNNGIPASSGVYFIQVRAGTFAAVKKVVLMK